MQDTIDIKVLQTLGMARDRFSHRPTGERGRFLSCYRSAGALGCHTRIRAGFPRDLSTSAENARSPETTDVCCSDRCMARDRPSPYGESGNAAIKHSEGQALALREGAAFFHRSRGLSPRR